MIDRRTLAKLFAGLPFFGPAAVDAAKKTTSTYGVGVLGATTKFPLPETKIVGPRSLPKMSAANAIKQGLLTRQDIENAIREEMQPEKTYDLDIDLHVNKSMAMNAKLRIQRERNLHRRVEGYFKGDSEYNNIHQLLINLARKHLWTPEDHQYEKERNARNDTEADSDW